MGVDRLWRDAGYVVGGLIGGIVADVFDLRAALWVMAGLSVLSAVIVAVHMRRRSDLGGDEVADLSRSTRRRGG